MYKNDIVANRAEVRLDESVVNGYCHINESDIDVAQSLATRSLNVESSTITADSLSVNYQLRANNTAIIVEGPVIANLSANVNILKSCYVECDELKIKSAGAVIDGSKIRSNKTAIASNNLKLRNSKIISNDITLTLRPNTVIENTELKAEHVKIIWDWPHLDGIMKILKGLDLSKANIVELDTSAVIRVDKFALAAAQDYISK